MGKMQRTKGANGERDVVNLLRDNKLEAKRISLLETNGIDKGDVLVEGQIASVKVGSHVPKFLYDARADADYLIARRDRKEWLAVVPVEVLLHYLLLVKGEKKRA